MPRPPTSGVEIARTRKGRVVLDQVADLYTVWIDQGDGGERSVLDTKDQAIAVAWLKDWRE